MTKEQAIDWLRSMLKYYDEGRNYEAISLAIAALESEPLVEAEGWLEKRKAGEDGLDEWALIVEDGQTTILLPQAAQLAQSPIPVTVIITKRKP
jgi:hypothetical protein